MQNSVAIYPDEKRWWLRSPGENPPNEFMLECDVQRNGDMGDCHWVDYCFLL